jgi:hypothetical protein
MLRTALEVETVALFQPMRLATIERNFQAAAKDEQELLALVSV